MRSERLADGYPELVEDRRTQTDLRRSPILSDGGGAACRAQWLYFTDPQAVIAQAERGIGDGEAARIGTPGAGRIARRRAIGGRVALAAGFDQGVEIGAAGDARRIPPRAGRIVGDRGKGAAHAERPHADHVGDLGRGRGRQTRPGTPHTPGA